MRRLLEGARTAPVKTVGSAVWQVFEGTGVATVGDRRFELSRGDLFVVPSWDELVLEAGTAWIFSASATSPSTRHSAWPTPTVESPPRPYEMEIRGVARV